MLLLPSPQPLQYQRRERGQSQDQNSTKIFLCAGLEKFRLFDDKTKCPCEILRIQTVSGKGRSEEKGPSGIASRRFYGIRRTNLGASGSFCKILLQSSRRNLLAIEFLIFANAFPHCVCFHSTIRDIMHAFWHSLQLPKGS
jgi:hypothetical protein